MIRLLTVASLTVTAIPQSTAFDRQPETQVLHLDVGDLDEARAVRLAVLSAWSRTSDDDVIIEPMADAAGRRFYCVHLARQEP